MSPRKGPLRKVHRKTRENKSTANRVVHNGRDENSDNSNLKQDYLVQNRTPKRLEDTKEGG